MIRRRLRSCAARFEINLQFDKREIKSRWDDVRASKIEENVAMMNEIRGAIGAKFND